MSASIDEKYPSMPFLIAALMPFTFQDTRRIVGCRAR